MFQTNTINLSKIYAGTLIKHLGTVNFLKYKIVQEAPFRVLKLPDIPAVLIETAFISNPQEENLLKKNSFQKTLATAISSSIIDYFGDTDKVQQSNTEPVTSTYKIKKGDTLFSVARRFNTKVDDLLKLNHLKLEDHLLIGRKIMVPVNKTENGEDNGAEADKTDEN
jgi:N-acetylmuramoyl-L-alanine amidase